MLNIDEIRDKCKLFSMLDVGTVKLLLNELTRLRAENEKLRELCKVVLECPSGWVKQDWIDEAGKLLGRE